MYNNITGSNYNRNLTGKEINNIIKTELKKEYKDYLFFTKREIAGTLEVLTLTIKAKKELVFNSPINYSDDGYINFTYDSKATETFTSELNNLINKAKELYDSYNYDHGYSQGDYFDVNFYNEIIIKWN